MSLNEMMRGREYELVIKTDTRHDEKKQFDSSKCYSLVDIKNIKRELPPKVFLNDLLEDCFLKFNVKDEPVKKNPELQKRLDKLRKEQQNRDYREITRGTNVFVTGKSNIAPTSIHTPVVDKSVNKQLSMVANFFISLALTYFVGHWLAAYFSTELAIRVMAGVIIASVVAFAEIYIFFRYWI